MTPVQAILARFPDDPFRSARTIRRSFKNESELPTAAAAWCAAVAEKLPLMEESFGDDPWADVQHLLLMASIDSEVFSQWVTLARQEKTTYDKRQLVQYDRDLIRALAYCWPKRSAGPEQLLGALSQWVLLATMRRATRLPTDMWFDLARTLCEYPEVAYGLLDISAGLQAQLAPDDNGIVHPMVLALERRRLRYQRCPRDEQELARITSEIVLENNYLWGYIRNELVQGRPIDLNWQDVVGVLRGPRGDLRWYRALKLLAASPEQQEHVVATIARLLEEEEDPVRELSTIVRLPRALTDGVFTGRGWGRDDLPRKLLPISRVFIRKRKWPGDVWRECFERRLNRTEDGSEDNSAELAHERVREVLAEAFLDRALDQHEKMGVRSVALKCIGILQPGGSRSIARAVGKLLSTELEDQARHVSKRLREGARSGRTDAELAVLEAWEYFAENAEASPARSGSSK